MSGYSSTISKEIRIQYYALLREERGLSVESLITEALTARDLYTVLQERYGFTLPVERLKVAINDVFAEWDQPLRANDSVVFIPPVAGG